MPSLATKSNQDPWDDVAKALRTLGVATVDFDDELEAVHARSFSLSLVALNVVKRSPESVPWIPVSANSASATGYHSAGGDNSLSRYNQYREGFVVSDHQFFGVDGVSDFQTAMMDLSSSLHDVAEKSLAAIERQLEIPCGWFQENLGPTRTSSQFHVKRYVFPDQHEANVVDSGDGGEDEPRVVLPMHTDPSLISVILHDAKGKNPSAMGLEYFNEQRQSWIPVPFHGHRVAIVLVGSVLSYMTGNLYPSIKHRVVEDRGHPERVAATLFVRPQPCAALSIPPSPQLDEKVMRKKPVTFAIWIARVSRNYSKRKSG